MDYKPEALDGFFKRLQKPLPLPLPIIAINWLTFVAAGRDMIHGAFKLYSDWACHNARYDTATRCHVSRVDPQSNDDRQLVGLDIDMAHQLAKDLGVQIEFVPFSQNVSELLRRDHFDIAMSGLEGTIRRAVELPHVEPYLEITVALVVPDYRRSDFRTLEQFSELTDLRIAVIADSKASELRADSLVGWGSREMLTDAEIVELANKREFFESDPPVADILVTSAEVGSAWTLRYPEFSVVKPVDLNVRLPLYYFVADESQFEEFLENWLALKRRDGTIQQLYDYWILGKDDEGHTPRWCLLRDVLHWVN